MLFPLPPFSPEHIHPMLVNFTAALVPASVASDLAGRALKRPVLYKASWWMLVYAAAITPFTALAGLWWKKQAADMLSPELIQRHLWLGVGLTVGLIALTVWRWKSYSKETAPSIPYLILGVIVVVALVAQGTLGGMMLFGS